MESIATPPTPTASPAGPPAGAAPPSPDLIRRLLVNGEAMIASTGIALSAILLAAVAGVGFWALNEQAASAEQAQADRVRSLAGSIGSGVEALMAQNDLSAVRRVVADAALAQQLTRCRVVLPSGRVVATSLGDVQRVTAVHLPPSWPDKRPPADASLSPAPGTVAFTQPLIVPGRGVAYLQLAAAVPDVRNQQMETLTAVGSIGAAALVGVLLIYRRMRARLRGITAVRAALLEMFPAGAAPRAAQAAAATLVSPDLGPEAVAWNALMADRDAARKDAVADKARQSLGRRRQARGDLDAACDAMSQGLVLLDDAGRVRYANGAAAAFLRADREKLVGADLASVLSVEPVLAALKEVAAGTLRRRAVIDVEPKDDGAAAGAGPAAGSPAAGVLRFSVRPVRREDAASAMVIIEDVTQQKAAEAARHAFVAQATHELRTPLTNIRLYVEHAIEDGDADPTVRTQALNVINGEARRLERIVGEMLSVAEIEAGHFKLKADDVRLDALFDELRHDYQQQATEKRMGLQFLLPPKLPVITGDRDKVAIALHNIVGNALKYTPEGGQVTVRVEADDARVLVAVADTGIGIAAEDCERVFERFYRANDRRVAKITGTGLGLPIAREVARLHGGDVTVESQLDRGSTFTLTLPLKPAA